jgi:REP element-mobilizing transposase RayT
MSRTYKFLNPEGIYFISFATVGWIYIFTRRIYKDIKIDSLDFCQKNKGLRLFCYVIMSNHLHLMAKAQDGFELSWIIRDFKKYTSKQIIKAIEENNQKSEKEW